MKNSEGVIEIYKKVRGIWRDKRESWGYRGSHRDTGNTKGITRIQEDTEGYKKIQNKGM